MRSRMHPALAAGLGLLLVVVAPLQSHAASPMAPTERAKFTLVGRAQEHVGGGHGTLTQQGLIKGTHAHLTVRDVITCPAADPRCRDLFDATPAKTKLCGPDRVTGTLRNSRGVLRFHVLGTVCQPAGSAQDHINGHIVLDGGTGSYRTLHSQGTYRETLALRPSLLLQRQTAISQERPAHVFPIIIAVAAFVWLGFVFCGYTGVCRG